MPHPVSLCIAVMDGKLGGAWVQGCATPDTLEYVPFSVSCDFNFIIPVLLCVCVCVCVCNCLFSVYKGHWQVVNTAIQSNDSVISQIE